MKIFFFPLSLFMRIPFDSRQKVRLYPYSVAETQWHSIFIVHEVITS
jgi:hypothetical protein